MCLHGHLRPSEKALKNKENFPTVLGRAVKSEALLTISIFEDNPQVAAPLFLVVVHNPEWLHFGIHESAEVHTRNRHTEKNDVAGLQQYLEAAALSRYFSLTLSPIKAGMYENPTGSVSLLAQPS